MPGHVIFLSGPIGAGKTTLGRELAARLKAVFLDGDDFARPDTPWYACILQTSRGILQAGIAGVEQKGIAVVAYPLGRINWIYFKRSFEDRGVRTTFVSLRAAYASIVNEGRGRLFSAGERQRIQGMIEEGYDARSFSDLIVDTDIAGFDEVLAALERDVRTFLER
jgi:cytidylate kinase